MRKTNINQRLIAAWAGIIGSVLFIGAFTLEGFLRHSYNPLEMYISALSLGPRGWIQITNFVAFGALMLVFTRGVIAEFPSGKASKSGLVLLTIISVLFMISGPFVMDPIDTPQNQTTIHGSIHGLAGGIIFLLMPISCFVYLRRFRVDSNWQSFHSWTLALGIVEAVGVLVFIIVSKLPEEQNAFVNWLGLIQRIAVAPFILWLFVFALKLLGRSKQN
jgi:hypothetical protein